MTEKLIASVGGSIGRACSGAVTAGSAMVLETVALMSPAMATISPASALSTGTRSRPRKANTLVARPSSTTLPSTSIALIGMLVVSLPLSIRPVRMRPRNGSRSSKVASIRNGPASTRGRGTWLTMVSNSGVRSPERTSSVRPGIAGAAAGVERREVELLVIGLEVEEQLEHLVEHFGRARVGAVDLVDDDDRLEAERERLAGDELGLRHRPLGRVDQQDDAVDHGEDALDLGAEIGVAGRVDDVDVRSVPVDRGALGEDGDPALLLEVVRIHRPLLDALVVAEGAGLAEELVDKRRLAVIDVGDDRHVTEVH